MLHRNIRLNVKARLAADRIGGGGGAAGMVCV